MTLFECLSLTASAIGVLILAIYTFFTYRLFKQAQEQTQKAQEQIAVSQQQIEIARDAVKIQHLLTLVTQFGTEPLVTARRSLAQKRLAGDPEPSEMQDVLDFFETIGFLVRRNYLITRDVWDMFSYWMFSIFADFKDIIAEEQQYDPSYYRDFADLVRQLREVEHSEGCSDDNPGAAEIEEFWKDEMAIGSGIKKSRSRVKKNLKRKVKTSEAG